jgi:hypothetical protein
MGRWVYQFKFCKNMRLVVEQNEQFSKKSDFANWRNRWSPF